MNGRMDELHAINSPDAFAHRSWVSACEQAEAEVARLSALVKKLTADNLALRRRESQRRKKARHR